MLTNVPIASEGFFLVLGKALTPSFLPLTTRKLDQFVLQRVVLSFIEV